MSWWQTFATTPETAAHKSDFLTYARCTQKFKYTHEEKLGILVSDESNKKKVFGISLAGTAVHSTLERALPHVLAGKLLDPTHVRIAYHQEFSKAMVTEGVEIKDVHWPRERKADAVHKEMVSELYYFLVAAPAKIKRLIAVETKFTAPIKRKDTVIWTAGTIDILFETHDGMFVLGDYKSGKLKPTQIMLDAGVELGIYAHSILEGEFTSSTGVVEKYNRYPDEIYIIRVQDFMPALKDSNRKVWMRDECKHFGVSPGSSVKVKKGMQRGPGWYQSNRTPEQMPSLVNAVGAMTASIRMGRFFPVYSDPCQSCRFKTPCLAEGFGVSGKDKKRLESVLASMPPELLGDDSD